MTDIEAEPDEQRIRHRDESMDLGGGLDEGAPVRVERHRVAPRVGALGDGLDHAGEGRPTRCAELGRARRHRPPGRLVAARRRVQGQAQHLAAGRMEQAQPLGGDLEGVVGGSVDGGRQGDVDLGEAQPTTRELVAQVIAVREAALMLGALEPDPGDLVEDGRGVGRQAVVAVGVGPQHGDRPDRRPGERVRRAPERQTRGSR